MQSDLISRSKLHKSLLREKTIVLDGLQYIRADVVKEKLSMAPSVDAVSVVRCEDCMHRGEMECPMRFEDYISNGGDDGDWVIHDWTAEYGFCHCGEKKDAEHE